MRNEHFQNMEKNPSANEKHRKPNRHNKSQSNTRRIINPLEQIK